MSKRKLRVADYVSPILVVGALVSLARVEPEIEYTEMSTPAIERRDRFYGVASPTEEVIWLAGKEGKIVRSENRGEDWIVQQLPTVAPMQAIVAWDTENAVTLGNGGAAFYTQDGGMTWVQTEVPVSEISKKILSAKIDPKGRVWATAEFGVIVYSDDKGVTWSQASTDKVGAVEEEVEVEDDPYASYGDGEDIAWNSIGFTGQGGLVVVGEFGSVKISADNGLTWSYPAATIESSLMSVEFRDAMNGVAVGLEGAMLYTSDGGLTWGQAPKLTRQHLFDVTWDGKQWVAVGEKGIILFGQADGTQWVRERLAESEYSWHTDVLATAGGYLVAGLDAGFWSAGEWRRFGDK